MLYFKITNTVRGLLRLLFGHAKADYFSDTVAYGCPSSSEAAVKNEWLHRTTS